MSENAASSTHSNPLRGVIALNAKDCTSCMLCVRQCPTWCITLESHQEPDPSVPEGSRPRLINVLDEFTIDFARCMNCGICVDVCPFDALAWRSTTDYDEADRDALVHNTARLQGHW